jgi:hypothetical protein
MIDKPKEDRTQKSEPNRFVYEPGELQPYDPNDVSELTETGEDEPGEGRDRSRTVPMANE